MKTSIPYLERRIRRDAHGRVTWSAYYWIPSRRLRREGWKPMALGSDPAEAQKLAIRQNADVERARSDPARAGIRSGTIAACIRDYRADDEFPANLATRRSYNQNLNWLEAWAGDKPLSAITRRTVKELKKALAGTPYRANAIIGMIRILYGYAMREGLVELNPASQFRRITVYPRHQVWEPEQEAVLARAASAAGRQSLWLATALSLYAGQRQTDVVAMRWQQYDRDTHRLLVRQSKTKELVSVPVLGPLLPLLEEADRSSVCIVVSEATRQPYNIDTFRHEISNLIGKAELRGLQYRDLRRTSVVRMFAAGLSYEEISDVTGHKIESCREIVETYLPRGRRITEHTVQKLEDYYKKQV